MYSNTTSIIAREFEPQCDSTSDRSSVLDKSLWACECTLSTSPTLAGPSLHYELF